MTKERDDNRDGGLADLVEPILRQRRSRASRVKPLPTSMQDPRHDPEAAIAAIKTVHRAGGTVVNEDKFNTRRNNCLIGTIPADDLLCRDDTIRFRPKEVRTGPGFAKPSAARRIDEAEAAFARRVNEIDRISAFEAGKSKGGQKAAMVRREVSARRSARVMTLFDASALPARHRAASIARRMTLEGNRISVRTVREILARYRKYESNLPPA